MISSSQNNNNKNALLLAMSLTIGSYLPSYAASNSNAVVTDMQINSLIIQAIETHPLVGSARAEQEATTEGVNAAKLNLLPTPTVSTGYDNDDSVVSEVGIRQPLWTGGRLTANVNQAIFDDKAATENIYAQQNQVAKTTIEAWQTYITAVAQQRVYLETIKQLRNFEEMMQRRVKQGVSARIELDLVTNRILQETNAYEAALEQQHIAEARLQQITGRPLPRGSEHSVPELSTLVEQVKTASIGFEKMAFNEASFYNPTVVKEMFEVESAKQEVKAQDANKFPTIFAEYKHTFDHDNHRDDGQIYVGINYQPGAGFSNLALTRASEARVNSLIQNKEAAQREVMENIQVQYQQFASAKSRELSLVSAVAGAQIVLDSYQRQFIAGRKSWLEVLNSVRELSDYQINLVKTRSDILGSFYKLQVDFSLMPWQSFNKNRQPVDMFSVKDPVKNWINGQQNKPVQSKQFGYGQNNVVEVEDEYIEVNLPASVQQQLDQGAYIMIDEQGNPITISEENSVIDQEVESQILVKDESVKQQPVVNRQQYEEPALVVEDNKKTIKVVKENPDIDQKVERQVPQQDVETSPMVEEDKKPMNVTEENPDINQDVEKHIIMEYTLKP